MKTACLAALLSSITLIGTVPLAAQEEAAYLDDRSQADQLVKSLYNAIGRHEFARAWDYFGDEKPAKDYAAFIKGYADTQSVSLLTGPVSQEGAAGSIFYTVPVAIRATANDGTERVFGGCYTARMAQPTIQEPPFRPMHIEKGALKAAAENSDLAGALPKSCGDEPAPAPADAALQKARAAFAKSYDGICQYLEPGTEADRTEPQKWEIKFRYSYEAESDPERSLFLFQFPCGSGAYNTIEVFYTVDQYGETKPLSFATPELDIRYENDDFEGKLKSMSIIGYHSGDQLINSDFDPEKKAIYSYSKWRGIGDASSVATYIFRGGEFTLVKYEADPTYDGEENLQTVLDFDSGP